MKLSFWITILFAFASAAQAWSQALPPEELKYIATKLRDSNCVIAVVSVPLGNDGLRKVAATGQTPESDSDYIALAIDKSLLKLYTIQKIKGDMDEVVFTNIPFGGLTEERNILFFPYPGTEWLMVLNKGLTGPAGYEQPAGWLQNIPHYRQYKWLNDKTVFIADAYKGDYSMKWNSKFEQEPTLLKVGEDFTADIKTISDFVSGYPASGSKTDFNTRLSAIKASLHTQDAKMICDYLVRK